MPFIYTEGKFLRVGDFSMLSLDGKFNNYGKVGLLSKEGKIVIPVRYDEIIATTAYYNYTDIPAWAVIQIRLNDKWGFYNPLNNMLVEPQFDIFFRHPGYKIEETEQFLFTKTANEIWLWNKATGKKILFCKYDELNSSKINTDNLPQYFK